MRSLSTQLVLDSILFNLTSDNEIDHTTVTLDNPNLSELFNWSSSDSDLIPLNVLNTNHIESEVEN